MAPMYLVTGSYGSRGSRAEQRMLALSGWVGWSRPSGLHPDAFLWASAPEGTSAAEAAIPAPPFIAAPKRCSTQNQMLAKIKCRPKSNAGVTLSTCGRSRPPQVPGGKLERDVEQLHDGKSHDHVGRDFHSAARLAYGFHYFRHVGGGLQQLVGQFVKVVGGASEFVQHARGIDQSGRRAFAIAQIQFGLAGSPPRTTRRVVVHALPNLLRRAGTE